MNASDFIECYENYVGDVKQLSEQVHDLIIRQEWQSLFEWSYENDQVELFKMCFLVTPVTFSMNKIDEITRHSSGIFLGDQLVHTKWEQNYIKKAIMAKFINECKKYCKYHYINRTFYYYFHDVHRTDERLIQLFSSC